MRIKEDIRKKYSIFTYGCQMNERDTETIAGLLEKSGYVEAASPEEANLIIFNTCSVRTSAENKVYGKLGEIKRLKKARPDLLVGFGGCMAQMEEVRKKLGEGGVVDIIFGTHNLHELPRLVEKAEAGVERPVIDVWPEAGDIVEGLPARRTGGVSAFVNIMFGCNNFCSYCIVPFTRGRERSRKPSDIIDEVKDLVQQGVKEVTLLGQNVNSYGKGLEPETDFASLLELVNEIPGLERIRFTTSHPRDVSERLLGAIASCRKVCEHIHAPLQAGSNRILKAMNRGYTREYYLDLVHKMREIVPGVAVTTDLIVGFPGESDRDFEDTIDMVKRIRFDAAFTFMYSPRSGTKAARLSDQVPLEVKKERLLQLNEIQYNIALEANRRFEGKDVEVLVEGPSKSNPRKLTGRTRTNRIVVFEGKPDLVGRLVMVRVREAKTFTLLGEAVEG
ncbi:MAG TPA: tRNA (N6-isopentenyl adenosine(37)-C2)-methylthiotransferase MiaB [Syntrophothermus lipocalidus]|nr:tRNA (N6-isopentenyl adenosine(37)-C2)-methylthiotransferase MiaB [Syntrophothermus lipocalidus]